MRAWPVASDFTTKWLGGNVSTDASTLAAELVEDATDYALENIGAAARAHYNIDPNDDLGCPAPLFRAIVLDAARILSRRSSGVGLELNQDFAAAIPNADADYNRFTRNYFNWPTL